ncbi:gliding motility protein GldN [Taibaiella lutea]|uniref:Gliding motility protein GldN n=2 Tax=Taibaiella lutea TaxID=2608001 RepID=A0A5M6CH17_9BACT|nr:gliding motility protein GldN [Taibaiella lutea]
MKMNILKKYSFAASIVLCSGAVFAQGPGTVDPASTTPNTDAVNAYWKPSLVKDGAIDAVPHVNRSLDQTSIREIDVAWKRRVWRVIDVRQKQNQAFIFEGDEYSGGGAFIEILIDAVRKGKVNAYSNIDDRFTTALDMPSLEKQIGGTTDTIEVPNIETGEMELKVIHKEFDINSVTQYRIKEDWIFDRNLGRMVVRIVGIAPMVDIKSESTGLYVGSSPMFWLNYDQLRKLLVNYEVYNPQNDVHRMSWADYFDGRYFASYVIKSTADNPDGRTFEKGLRGLEQGGEVTETLREKDDDMWSR